MFTNQSASGDILLGYGQHEVKVVLPEPCGKVGFSIHSPAEGCPACHGGDISKVGVSVLDNGFALYADIKTNTASVEWFCQPAE